MGIKQTWLGEKRLRKTSAEMLNIEEKFIFDRKNSNLKKTDEINGSLRLRKVDFVLN